ncbi:MAG: serine protease, partial [Candidatus Paceibacteria bacterium]
QSFWRNWILTAGHCDDINPVLVDSQGKRWWVNVYYRSSIDDYDLLVGWFGGPSPVTPLKLVADNHIRKGEKFLIIGYPGGSRMIVEAQYLGMGPHLGKGSRLAFNIALSPGFSGAPVLVPGTRKVKGMIQSSFVAEDCPLWRIKCPAVPPSFALSSRDILIILRTAGVPTN